MSKFNPKSPYLIFTAVLLAVIGGVFLILYFAGVFATPAAGEPPVAYWRFDEGYGGTAYDDSTNNNDGTIYGATWQSEDMCKSGKCLRFNGGGDKVSVSSTIIPNLQAFTISMWVKPGLAPASNYPIFFTSKGQYLYLAYHHSDDRFRLSWSDSGGTQRHVNAYGFSDENQWYYITAVLTASSQKLYVNGLEKGSASYTGFQSTAMTGADLGYYSSSYPFLGYLDDIRIYNYVRTPEQIKADYLGGGPKGSAIKVSSPSEVYNLNQGLVGYWKMDEASWNGTSGEVKDSSGNNNHGTAAGNALPVAGKFGNGGTFDGSGDYVNISNFNIGNTITLSAWLKSSAYNGKIPLSLDGDNYSSGPNIYFTGGKINWNTGDSENNPFYNGYPDANWHHFVVVNDYANNYAKLFIDGVEKGTAGYRNSTTTNGVFRIGDFHGGSYSFNGLIDDVRIYNRALNNREIRALYEWGPPPVGYWKMDERVAGDNKTIYDISGNGNNGTTHYGANAMGMDCTKPGKYGTACSFDGVDDYVIKNPISNFPKSAITTTFWIKTSDSNDGIISYASTASDNNWLIFNSANIQIYTVTSNVTTGVSINDNKWHFIAVTWNGTDGATKLYKDGKLSYSGTLASGGSITANGSLVIGVDQDSVGGGFAAGEFFSGLIDDIRIYNYARTQKQILEDMNASRPAQKSPVGYWKFDEGYGTTVYDSSGFGNNGTITGAAWTNNGKFGKALSFDGADDYVNCGGINNFKFGSGNFTISAWIKTSGGSPDWAGILWKGKVNNPEPYYEPSYSFSKDGSADNYFFHSGHWSDRAYFGSIEDNKWHYLVGVVDSGISKAYLDGVLKSQSTATNSDYDTAFNIGKGVMNRVFKGLIDEVKIYNYALSEEEIKMEYNQGRAVVMGTTKNAASTWDDGGFGGNPPIALWDFNEQVGDYANDKSGNNNRGTLGGGTLDYKPTWYSPGKIGSALEFDGSNDYVEFSNILNIGLVSNTVEAWIKVPSDVTDRVGVILGNYNDSPNSNWELAGPAKPRFYWNNGQIDAYINIQLNDNKWHHLAFVRDKSAGKIYGYVDGIQYTMATTSGSDINFTTVHRIGGDKRTSGSQFFNGLIDHVQIFDYARTPAQIAWDYNHGKPVAQWRFDEYTSGNASGQTLYDDSDNNNDGTGYGTDGPIWTVGKLNSALQFDGVDDYVRMPHNDSLNARTHDLTVALWIKASLPISGDGYAGIIWKQYGYGSDNGNYWWIRQASTTRKLQISFSPASGLQTIVESSKPEVLDNTWHHITGIFDRDVGIKLFIDGKFDNSVTGSSGFANDQNGTGPLHIGEKIGGNYSYFNGLIDDVRIYNYARTPEQILEDYNSGAIRIGI